MFTPHFLFFLLAMLLIVVICLILASATFGFHVAPSALLHLVKGTQPLSVSKPFGSRWRPTVVGKSLTARSLLSSSQKTDAAAESSLLQAITFCNLDREQEPQLLCDFLMEIGACSTSIVDADRDTEREVPWFDEKLPQQQQQQSTLTVNNDMGEDYDDPWSSIVSTASQDGQSQSRNQHGAAWPRCNVTAHFPASTDLSQVMQLVHASFQISFADAFSIERVPQRDWIVHVQQSWKPIVIGNNLILRFPWHTDDDVAQAVATSLGKRNLDGMVQLQLEGGVAFGTGEHPTTQLCLEYLQALMANEGHDNDNHDKIQTILDYGAGSGVLGLAACALASRRPAVTAIGVDIDVDAVRIANVNAETNGLPMTTYLPPLVETDDDESKSLLLKAHSYLTHDDTQQQQVVLPPHLQGPMYDVCVANILARPLVSLAPTLAALVRPGGYLGLSGILSAQANMVVAAYEVYFDQVQIQKELGGWVLITGLRKK